MQLKQLVNRHDDFLGRQVRTQDEVRFLDYIAFLGRIEQAASGDVEHHGFVPLYNACIDGLLQAGYSTGGCREDVIALEIDVLDNPLDNLVIADLEHVSVGFLEHVEKASCYAVRRFPV